jgi:hypothetical protein
MTGVKRFTVWTWNAIGKRIGAWGLKDDAPESQKGFLLNHIISELLPPREDGYRYSNSDPVTGQAAWYDLKVSIEKCEEAECGETSPMYESQMKLPNSEDCAEISRYGETLSGRFSGLDDVPHAEWLGNRQENACPVKGIRPGHGNKTRGFEDGEGGQ